MLSRRGFLSDTTCNLLASASFSHAEHHSASLTLPFLWEEATSSGYQTEGNSTNTDIWILEQVNGTIFKEHSDSDKDFYAHYHQDIALSASLGLNSFQFSIE